VQNWSASLNFNEFVCNEAGRTEIELSQCLAREELFTCKGHVFLFLAKLVDGLPVMPVSADETKRRVPLAVGFGPATLFLCGREP
jgi:hypothetical protein